MKLVVVKTIVVDVTTRVDGGGNRVEVLVEVGMTGGATAGADDATDTGGDGSGRVANPPPAPGAALKRGTRDSSALATSPVPSRGSLPNGSEATASGGRSP